MQQLKSKVKNVFHVHNHGPQSHSHLVAFRKHSPWLRAGLVETPSVTLSSQVRGLKVREWVKNLPQESRNLSCHSSCGCRFEDRVFTAGATCCRDPQLDDGWVVPGNHHSDYPLVLRLWQSYQRMVQFLDLQQTHMYTHTERHTHILHHVPSETRSTGLWFYAYSPVTSHISVFIHVCPDLCNTVKTLMEFNKR